MITPKNQIFQRRNSYFKLMLVIFSDPQFEGLTMEQWSEMLDRVELHDPGQMEIAGIVSGQFVTQNKVSQKFYKISFYIKHL